MSFSKYLITLNTLLLPFSAFTFEKSVILEQANVAKIFLEGQLDDTLLEQPNGFHLKTTLENIGQYPIHNLKFTVKQTEKDPSCSTQEEIFKNVFKVSQEKLLVEQKADENLNSTYTLNFCGTCSPLENALNLAHLAHSKGISSKLADLKGHVACEYLVDDEWVFLDGVRHAVYLNLDNKTFAGTDEIIQDPFLALRTKTSGKYSSFDLKNSWSNFANFECIDPKSYPEFNFVEASSTSQNLGYDFFPGDRLSVCHETIDDSILASQRLITHEAVLQGRGETHCYHSATPILRITNESNSSLYIDEVKVHLQPNEVYQFPKAELFELNLSHSHEATGKIIVESVISQFNLPYLLKGENYLSVDSETNPTKLKFNFDFSDEFAHVKLPKIDLKDPQNVFDHVNPFFSFKTEEHSHPNKIWWQISSSSDFNFILPNFNQIQDYNNTLVVDHLSNTFFNHESEYYFRVKVLENGVWSDWSPIYSFITLKPEAVGDVDFRKVGPNEYELCWEPSQDEDTQYLIYASNSLDFLPSLYTSKQITSSDLYGISSEPNRNFYTATSEHTLKIDSTYAFYRIIATRKGHYSVPSPLIYVFDNDLFQQRDIFQVNPTDPLECKRIIIPTSYCFEGLTSLKVPELARSYVSKNLNDTQSSPRYAYNANVALEVWNAAQSHFLPENHPAKKKLDKLFSANRVITSAKTIKKAKFNIIRNNPRNKIIAARHKKIKGYFFKIVPDDKPEVSDINNFMRRINGSLLIRQAIYDHGYDNLLKAPQKWLYPVPPQPGINPNEQKAFILVAEDMKVYSGKENRKKWKSSRMTPDKLFAVYTIMKELGLNDCIHVFNIPLSKDGRIAFIDTEDYHKWPVYFSYINKSLSKANLTYWKELIKDEKY